MATLIDAPGAMHPLLMFAGAMPPADFPLRIDWVETLGRADAFAMAPDEGGAVVCFTPGTWIETPGGARQIEHLAAGDKVMTADGGAQELVWTGTRRVTLRELQETPGLAPVRVREGALPSRRDSTATCTDCHEPVVRPVTYVHLLLERHHILLANGFETESFHPSSADLDAVPEADRMRLFDVMPMLKIEPQVYGPWARPVLSQAEAALLSAA